MNHRYNYTPISKFRNGVPGWESHEEVKEIVMTAGSYRIKTKTNVFLFPKLGSLARAVILSAAQHNICISHLGALNNQISIANPKGFGFRTSFVGPRNLHFRN